MANRFIKPKSIQNLPMGDYEYVPAFVVVEAASAEELQSKLNLELATNIAVAQDRYWAVESIQYQVTYAPGGSSYSALIWLTEVVVL